LYHQKVMSIFRWMVVYLFLILNARVIMLSKFRHTNPRILHSVKSYNFTSTENRHLKQPIKTTNGSSRAALSHPYTGTHRTPRELYFLHFPKTGTSFFRPLIAQACPWKNISEIDSSFLLVKSGRNQERCTRLLQAGHAPLPNSANLSKWVTILRNPLERIASGFVHGFHDCVAMTSNKKTRSFPFPCSPVKDATVLLYADCVKGCMTRMLNGMDCGGAGGMSPGRHQEEIAIRRLSNFSFVGFTEDWETTIARFLHRFPIASPANDFYENTRPSSNEQCKRDVLDVLFKHKYSDEADMRLYLWGKSSFTRHD
jgi:hypothetical protein